MWAHWANFYASEGFMESSLPFDWEFYSTVNRAEVCIEMNFKAIELGEII